MAVSWELKRFDAYSGFNQSRLYRRDDIGIKRALVFQNKCFTGQLRHVPLYQHSETISWSLACGEIA